MVGAHGAVPRPVARARSGFREALVASISAARHASRACPPPPPPRGARARRRARARSATVCARAHGKSLQPGFWNNCVQ
jgi:hypothetical protein